MEWESDWSLRLRMLGTLAVLAVVPMVFTATVSGVLKFVFDFPDAGLAFSVERFRLVFFLTLVGMVLAYVYGGRRLLRSTDAGPLPEHVERNLDTRLQRLAGTADVPTPEFKGIDSPVPNAYAAGRSQQSATIVVTRGLINQLDGDELDAVLAHELAHIKNRDAAVMSMVYLVPSFSYLVADVTYGYAQVFFTGFSQDDVQWWDDWYGALIAFWYIALTAVVTITISAVFWVASSVLFMLLSQYREYAADRGAAAITGDPLALASALVTIDKQMKSVPDQDLRKLDGGAEALYISSLGVGMFEDAETITKTLSSQQLFPSSHPPTRARVQRLRELAAELESD